MSRRARGLRPLDPTRLGQAASRPGIDPRTWALLGSVIEVQYEQGLVIVVRVVEGALAGEELACEVCSALQTAGGTLVAALREGDLALVCVPSGEPNNMGLVVGFLHEPESVPPATVNGVKITAALLEDTHLLADPDRALELELKTVRLVAEQVQLGPTPDPTQAFVRGTAFMKALSTFLTACSTLANTVQLASAAASTASVGVLAPLQPFFASFSTALLDWEADIATLNSHLIEGDALSKHITGE